MNRIGRALIGRELAVARGSRALGVFALACVGFGATAAFGDAPEGATTVWLTLPLLLYVVPTLGLLTGVSAARGDALEEPLIEPRVASIWLRLAVKWVVWSFLLAMVTLAWILPAGIRSGRLAAVAPLWGQSFSEVAVFVSIGIAVGRLVRDSVGAHLLAVLFGLGFTAGGGLLGWMAANSVFFQERPEWWTFGLMAHPVEALRVSLMFSLENLPFGRMEAPPIAQWWLSHSGVWYVGLAMAWSLFGLFLGGLRRPET